MDIQQIKDVAMAATPINLARVRACSEWTEPEQLAEIRPLPVPLSPEQETFLAVVTPAVVSELIGEVERLQTELKDAENWIGDVEEREAAVCPEDVPFDEYIRVLEKKLEEQPA